MKKWDFKRIEPSLKPAPEFDARLLPDAFVDYVADAAYRMQVSPDYNACTIDAGFNCGMKLLLDEHISRRIIPLILEAYPESTQVELLGMSAYSDVQLWAFARDNGYILVTKDSDFNDLSALYSYPPKVIWLKCGKRWGKVIAFSISIKPQTLAVAAYNSVSTD